MERLEHLDIKYLKGVGEARAKLLASELDVRTFRDLLYNFPFRHIDRSRFYHISDFSGDMPMVQVRGRFIRFSIEGEGARSRLVATFSDGHNLMEVVWFRRVKTMADAYRLGKEYVLFGKPVLYRNVYSMAHPEVEEYNASAPPSGLRGVYSLTENLRKKFFSSKTLQRLMQNLLEKVPVIEDVLPLEIVRRLNLMPLQEALKNMHFPSDLRSLQKAQERMKFEELFYLQLHILRFSRDRGQKVKGLIFRHIGDSFNRFYNDVLPFSLTSAQKRVIKEIREDMRTGRQMNRLLQGDVGSGKTMVAFMSMLIAVDNGFQACLMAPTEILACQHFEEISKWGNACGVNVGLLTGSVRASARKQLHEGLQNGEINILIGTHAVIEDTVGFRNLGMVVIDEQHRFGVAQRAKLWGKNENVPHVLVMTATPIPRTLALTVYGDLDVSVIDELPPGRKPVSTILMYDDRRVEVDRAVFSQLRAGRQVYIVYPLIRENEKLSLKSLEEGYKRTVETFKDYRVCYVHGQMKPDEKEYQMQLFVKGEARIMVATTVIEVGVNVPNASVMIIENAERFGLSQLHQLRGRVGRGADKSYCILMSRRNIAADTRKRLEIMTQTTDGFIISEADMKMRGPGDMEGTQQSGLAFNLKVASLSTDGQIVQQARDVAMEVLDANPQLSAVADDKMSCKSLAEDYRFEGKDLALLRRELKSRFPHTIDWSRIS